MNLHRVTLKDVQLRLNSQLQLDIKTLKKAGNMIFIWNYSFDCFSFHIQDKQMKSTHMQIDRKRPLLIFALTCYKCETPRAQVPN